MERCIHPQQLTAQHRQLINVALYQTPTAKNLEQLTAANPDLEVDLLTVGKNASPLSPTIIPDSQPLSDGGGRVESFEQVIREGRKPWVGGLPGVTSFFFQPSVEELLQFLPEKRASFWSRVGITFAFNKGTMHSRTRAIVFCSESIEYLRSAFPGLKPHLKALGTGRVVAWYDIPKHRDELRSCDMPLAMPEVDWLQAQHDHLHGSGGGFAGITAFPLPAIIYMLFYHPKAAMPAATGNTVDAQRKAVFTKLSLKPGCTSPQAAQDLEELQGMLLRYSFVQTKMVPAVYKYGTGDIARRPGFDGTYPMFYPSDPALSPEQYDKYEYSMYSAQVALADSYAEGVKQHTSAVKVCESRPDSAVFDASGYTKTMANFVLMPYQPASNFFEVFGYNRSNWANVAGKDPQLHFYCAKRGQWVTEPKLSEKVLVAKLQQLSNPSDRSLPMAGARAGGVLASAGNTSGSTGRMADAGPNGRDTLQQQVARAAEEARQAQAKAEALATRLQQQESRMGLDTAGDELEGELADQFTTPQQRFRPFSPQGWGGRGYNSRGGSGGRPSGASSSGYGSQRYTPYGRGSGRASGPGYRGGRFGSGGRRGGRW